MINQNPLEKCGSCGYMYPCDILSPLMSSDGNMGEVCGICALKMSNEILGIERDRFDGEMAEEMRLDAIEFRKSGQLTD